MNVLVVAKKTNLELHGETIRKRVQAGLIDPVYFELLESTHADHYTCLHELYSLLTKLGINYSTVNRGLYWPDLDTLSAVITVGGDGTVLEASHHILDNRLILVGVRSANTSVGKLCHCAFDGLAPMIQLLAENKLKPLSVARLQARVLSAETGKVFVTEPILNDFLFANASPAATTRYKIAVGDQIEEHRSSGVWISTPCGSTAAILAAGGKAMPLKSREFQFIIRELYDVNSASGKKSLANSPFDPDQIPIRIENLSEKAVLACDGSHGTVHLTFGDTIHFERGPDLRLAAPSFYHQR